MRGASRPTASPCWRGCTWALAPSAPCWRPRRSPSRPPRAAGAPASAGSRAGRAGAGGAGLRVALRVPAPPQPVHAPRQTIRESIAGIREVVRIPSVGRLFLMQMATYSSFVIFVGLWGGPYLAHVYGYDLPARGGLLLVPGLAQVLGLTAHGWAGNAPAHDMAR